MDISAQLAQMSTGGAIAAKPAAGGKLSTKEEDELSKRLAALRQ